MGGFVPGPMPHSKQYNDDPQDRESANRLKETNP